MTTPTLLGLFSDEPSQSATMAPSAIESRRSGLRVARQKAPTQMLDYIAALQQCGPASDHEIARVLSLPIATVNARRADATQAYPGRIEAAGRMVVHHPNGKKTSRTLWKFVGTR